MSGHAAGMTPPAPTITARCHPALREMLPPPVPAARALPDWLREMPSELDAPSLGGARLRTLKHCPPLIDALSLGLVIPLPCDLTVAGGEISWDWSPPPLPETLISRAPVGIHMPEQVHGAPVGTGGVMLKFLNFWTIEAPPGWQVLFTHPLNRPDLPFTTLSGVVDCDRFAAGYVHFPALLDPSFEGVIARGTPVAQLIPRPRAPVDLRVEVMDEEGIAANRAVQAELQSAPGVYRKSYRA